MFLRYGNRTFRNWGCKNGNLQKPELLAALSNDNVDILLPKMSFLKIFGEKYWSTFKFFRFFVDFFELSKSQTRNNKMNMDIQKDKPIYKHNHWTFESKSKIFL